MVVDGEGEKDSMTYRSLEQFIEYITVLCK